MMCYRGVEEGESYTVIMALSEKAMKNLWREISLGYHAYSNAKIQSFEFSLKGFTCQKLVNSLKTSRLTSSVLLGQFAHLLIYL